MIYLDNSAGTRPYPQVIETITNVLSDHWGNASSDNSIGHDAKLIINETTKKVANDICCDVDEIIWTSGACEANSLAIMGLLNSDPRMHFYTTRLEHTSIVEIVKNRLNYPRFFLNNDKYGYIDLEDLEKQLQEDYQRGSHIFVSVSFANSEIGTIQNIKAISDIVHKYKGILHTDATQAYPWLNINVRDLGIDMMSVSGQKMHCVKGVGFLYVKNGIKLQPMIYGSQQEYRRGGTYPTHLIAAFGTALEITRNLNVNQGVFDLRNYLLNQLLLVDGVHLNGPDIGTNRLPNNISLTIDDVDADKLVTMCDLMGIIIAKGSACKSYEQQPSKTLLSIGLSVKEAQNTIRISLSGFNSFSDVKQAAEIITKLIERVRNEK